MAKVTFDYSKAAPFINEDELNLMEAQVAAAKKLLVDRSGCRQMISLDGLIFR